MRIPILPSCLALFTCWMLCGCATAPTGVAGHQEDPDARAAVLDTVDKFFVAMAARDAAAFAAAMTTDGMTYSLSQRDGHWQRRSRANQDLAKAILGGTGALAETYWQPTVLLRGPIAVVWTPYRFALDGKVTHHGVDVFHLVKQDDGWRIANAMWTIEPEAAAELAPAEGATVRPTSLR